MERARSPPTPITTIGEARKARRQQSLEARASKEVCPVRAAQDTTEETSKWEVNPMVIVNPSTTTNVKGTEISVPQPKANTSISPQKGENENSREKYLGQNFIQKGKSPLVSADVVPEPSKKDSSNANESRRGFRHPEEPPATQKSNWNGNEIWPPRNNWKE